MTDEQLDEIIELRTAVVNMERRSKAWDDKLAMAQESAPRLKQELAAAKGLLTAKLAALTNGPQS